MAARSERDVIREDNPRYGTVIEKKEEKKGLYKYVCKERNVSHMCVETQVSRGLVIRRD